MLIEHEDLEMQEHCSCIELVADLAHVGVELSLSIILAAEAFRDTKGPVNWIYLLQRDQT